MLFSISMLKILNEVYFQEDMKLKFSWAFCVLSGKPNIDVILCVLNSPLTLF